MSYWPDSTKVPSPDDSGRAQARAIRCLPGEIAPHVLLPGDPARARMIAERFLDDARLTMMNREFHTYTGSYRSTPVSVISTGLGSPGAAMVVRDIAMLGAKSAIRIGTAGSGTASVHPGDLVVATGTVRDEGVTKHFMDPNYPAVPDADLSEILWRQCVSRMPNEAHRGIIYTTDAFHSPMTKDNLAKLANAGVLAHEMEAAAVFVLGSLSSLPTACILAVDGFVANVHSGNVVPDALARDRAISAMIEIALDATVAVSQNEMHSAG